MLKLTENREALMHRVSEQAAFARTVEIGQFHTRNESGMDGNSSALSCREYSGEGIPQEITSNSQRTREDRDADRNRSFRICRNFG